MSLKRGEVNPLGILGLRKLNFIPKHFSKIIINKPIDVNLLDHWINYNLNSRYAITKILSLSENKKIVESLEIGIEDPKEITMLTLGCPFLI